MEIGLIHLYTVYVYCKVLFPIFFFFGPFIVHLEACCFHIFFDVFSIFFFLLILYAFFFLSRISLVAYSGLFVGDAHTSQQFTFNIIYDASFHIHHLPYGSIIMCSNLTYSSYFSNNPFQEPSNYFLISA